MRKSINKMVGYRVAAALISVVLFSVVTTVNIMRIKAAEAENAGAFALLNRAQSAEAAHYKWSSGLSNALYAGKEFTGSIDPTTCVLGKWLYGEAGTEDEKILSLRAQMEPLHKALHESATEVLEMLETNPARAQSYYQETIQANLTTLVGLLEQVVEEGSAISEKSMATVQSITLLMNILCPICLVVALACLLSLVQYVLRRVVRPILEITRNTAPLQEGRLNLEMGRYGNNELGDLSSTLEKSMAQVHGYVQDLNAVMDGMLALDYIDGSNFFLLGASQGGFVSSYVAAKRPDDVKALMLLFPAYALQDDCWERHGSIENIPETESLMNNTLGAIYSQDAMSFDIYDVIGGYKGDVLICHGDKDDLVDLSYSERAVEVYEHAELKVIKGAGHGFQGKPLRESLVEFLQAHTN